MQCLLEREVLDVDRLLPCTCVSTIGVFGENYFELLNSGS